LALVISTGARIQAKRTQDSIVDVDLEERATPKVDLEVAGECFVFADANGKRHVLG
jgi:hypothetical protein